MTGHSRDRDGEREKAGLCRETLLSQTQMGSGKLPLGTGATQHRHVFAVRAKEGKGLRGLVNILGKGLWGGDSWQVQPSLHSSCMGCVGWERHSGPSRKTLRQTLTSEKCVPQIVRAGGGGVPGEALSGQRQGWGNRCSEGQTRTHRSLLGKR